jgi:hypothetical protein
MLAGAIEKILCQNGRKYIGGGVNAARKFHGLSACVKVADQAVIHKCAGNLLFLF